MVKASANMQGWQRVGEYRLRQTWFGFLRCEEKLKHFDGRVIWVRDDHPAAVIFAVRSMVKDDDA